MERSRLMIRCISLVMVSLILFMNCKPVQACEIPCESISEKVVVDAVVEEMLDDTVITKDKTDDTAITEDKADDTVITEDKANDTVITEDNTDDIVATEENVENIVVKERKEIGKSKAQVSKPQPWDLGLDDVDFRYMVSGNDGWYYWVVLNPSAQAYWSVRFHANLDTKQIYDWQVLSNGERFEAWTDFFGSYVWNAENWEGWGGHDCYTFIAINAYLQSLQGSGGHINARIDHSGPLDAFWQSNPNVNMYIKSGGNRTVTLSNCIALGECSWKERRSIGYGAIFHLDNGTQTLRTRNFKFDGNDHYTYMMSTAANAVYVADGRSYYSYNDEFTHGQYCAVISNHHSNDVTRQYGESYVNIDHGYFHDCLQGVCVNNRVDITNTRFENCVNGIGITGQGGPGGGYCVGGINGLWNPWGSRATISNCTINSSRDNEWTGDGHMAARGINIEGNYLQDQNATSVTINNTSVSTKGDGIYISPVGIRNVKINSSNISGKNKNSFGIYCNNPGGLVELSNTNISGAATGINNKAGRVTVNSGAISNNRDAGIRNDSELIYNSGKCGDNGGYDIYQNGDCKMSGDARIYSKGIYLTPNHLINITSPITCNDGTIKVTLDGTDSKLGRKVAYCSYGLTKNNGDAMSKKFAITNKRTTSGRKHPACLRSGNGVNGPLGNIILSEECYISFDKNINNRTLTAVLPEMQTHYWKEEARVPCKEIELLYAGKKFNSLVHSGWNKSKDCKSDGCVANGLLIYPAEAMTDDKIVYATYTGGVIDLGINGNNQTKGENYTIFNFENNKSLIPQNTFEKRYEEIIYDKNLDHDELERKIYSHEGWHISNEATYKDSPYMCGETADFTCLIYQLLASNNESVNEDGNINIVLYCVWDAPPEIELNNWWIDTNQFENGELCDEKILKRAKVFDKEDGEKIKLEVNYPVSKDYYYSMGKTGVWKNGQATVTVKATDSRGNEATKLMYIGVHKAGAIESGWNDESKGELPMYVRSISKKFYDKRGEAEGLSYYSIWYIEPEYQETILDAFSRMERNQPVMTYEFDAKDIRRSQQYCRTSFENETGSTNEHYNKWIEMFKDNRAVVP